MAAESSTPSSAPQQSSPSPFGFLYYVSKDYTREENQLAKTLSYMRQLALGGLLLTPFYITAGITSISTTAPFFISNTLTGLFMLWMSAWLAAGDVRRFRGMIRAVIVGLIAGLLTPLLLCLAPLYAPLRLVMGLSGIGLVVPLMSLIWSLRRAEDSTKHLPEGSAVWQPKYPDDPPGTVEKLTCAFLIFFGIGSLLFAGIETILAFQAAKSPGQYERFIDQPFFIIGSNIKLILLGYLAIELARDVRRNFGLISILIAGNIASFVVIGLLLPLFHLIPYHDSFVIFGITVTIGQLMLASLVLDASVVVALLFLWNRLHHALLPTPPANIVPDNVAPPTQLQLLNPRQFRALEAIAETLIAGGTGEVVEPYRVVWNVDRYLSGFKSKRLGMARMAINAIDFIPIVGGTPPLSYLNADARRLYIQRFLRDDLLAPPVTYRPIERLFSIGNWIILHFRHITREERETERARVLRFDDLMEAVIRINTQLCYMGYYSDPNVWEKQAVAAPPNDSTRPTKGIGYVPFSKRPVPAPERRTRPERYPELDVTTPQKLDQQAVSAAGKIVIIGSGAAGGILAAQLLERDPNCSIILLEKGPFVPSKDFTEDEVGMIGKLYSDGALQLSQSLRFSILQGSCVGGSTVVNNAVCFRTPPEVLDKWNANGRVIEPDEFLAAQDAVMDYMRINPITAATRIPLDDLLNHGDNAFINKGMEEYFRAYPQQHDYSVVSANIEDCLGCGYCNIGCAFDRKLSVLTEVLPKAQQAHPGRLQILSEAQVVKLHHRNGRVHELIVEVGSGDKRQRLTLQNPDKVIVSGGVIASSWLLMNSGIDVERKVGRGVSFNMGTPLHGWFGQKVNSYDGLQIAHYLRMPDHTDFVYETWYNPPVAQALIMPGWLDTHFENMQRYDEMAAVGILVGTEATGRVQQAITYPAPEVSFKPSRLDMEKLSKAMTLLREILFAAGAKEVYVSSRRHSHYTNPHSRRKAAFTKQENPTERERAVMRGSLDWVSEDERDVMLASGHPQGGNALGKVINPDFMVKGFDNLYVCDASVFPTSITVNPQLTVMTMAHYAASRIV